MESKVVNVAIAFDEKGNPIDCLQVRTITKSYAKEIATKVQSRKESLAEQERLKEQARNERQVERERKIENHKLLTCYLMFNQFVELGKCETTQEFEEMFDNFLNGGVFDKSVCPTMFLKVYERLS